MSEHKFDPVEESKEISSPKMGWGRYLDLLMKDGFLFISMLISNLGLIIYMIWLKIGS